MSDSSDYQTFLNRIRANPDDDTALSAYADWLASRDDDRATYLRLQVQYRNARTPQLRQKLIESYPCQSSGWVLELEQMGAVEANLTNHQFAWWGTGIGPARAAGGTYEMFRFQDQPPLPARILDGSFDWLQDSEPECTYDIGPRWRTFCHDARSRGYFVPEELERFMTDSRLPGRIKSCTDNYFKEPEEREILERDDGLLVSFFADSQYCVLWSILLPREPGRYAPVVSGFPDDLYPGIWGDVDEEEAEASEGRSEPVVAASQFEAFLYRYWIENEIWFATEWDESLRDLTDEEQAYVDHLHRVYG